MARITHGKALSKKGYQELVRLWQREYLSSRGGEPQRLPTRGQQTLPLRVAKLRTKLEAGKIAAVLPLEYDPDKGDWIASPIGEQLVTLGPTEATRYDIGSDVLVAMTRNGPTVLSGSLMGFLPVSGSEYVSYGVYEIGRGIGGVGSNYTGVLRLVKDNHAGSLGNVPKWKANYAFLGAMPEDPPRNFRISTTERFLKLWPVTTQTPAWVAYNPSATTANISSTLAQLLGIQGNSMHASPGEFWGPGGQGKLVRAYEQLPLYWWKWTPPTPECIDNSEYDPDYDPVPPEIVDFDKTIPGYWQHTNVPCDPADPGDAPDNVVGNEIPFLAPDYWWAYSDWDFQWGWRAVEHPHTYATQPWSTFYWNHYGWWHWGWWWWWWNPDPPPDWPGFQAPDWVDIGQSGCCGEWKHPSVLGSLFTGFSGFTGASSFSLGANFSSVWYGSRGNAWWFRHWGGEPPPSDPFPPVTTPMPQPDVGTITKGCLWGWVVWRWGWQVIASDTNNEICQIIGQLDPRNVIEVHLHPTAQFEDCTEVDIPPPTTTGTGTTGTTSTGTSTSTNTTTATTTSGGPTGACCYDISGSGDCVCDEMTESECANQTGLVPNWGGVGSTCVGAGDCEAQHGECLF